MRRRLLVCLLAVLLPLAQAKTRCLGRPEVTPKRYVSSGGTTVPLTLGATDRLTNRLATQVYAIFLQEVLGYPEVIINSASEESPTVIFESLSSYYSEKNLPNGYMVNLEVWLPPDLNTVHYLETTGVKECGIVGPPGRFGWFIPKSLSKVKDNLDSWTVFKSLDTAKVFSMSKKNRELVLNYALPRDNSNQATNLSYCNLKKCNTGLFTPPWCEGKSCALLIAENINDTKLVKTDIINQKLYVEVAWVGSDILKLATELENIYRYETGRSLVYLSQIPSVLTLRTDHTSISFPPCDEYSNSSLAFNCHYSNIRLVKVAWGKLHTAARPAFEALQKMEFSTDDYKELVRNYLNRPETTNPEERLWDVTCDWMKKHNESVYEWAPNDEERNFLYIGGIFPLKTNITNTLTARGIVVSSIMAINAINSNQQILRDYNLKLLLDNGKCETDEVMRIFIKYIQLNFYNKLVGILGPACSDTVEPLAGVAKHFRTMVVSYSAEGSSFSRAKYPYFFRTIGENQQYMYVYLKLLKLLEWTRVASLTEDGTKYTEYISRTQDLLQTNGIAFVANRKFPREWEKDAMKQYLEELKMKNARIIIADVNDKAARAVMCEAYLLKMTAYHGWVWFLPHWLSKKWYEVPTLNKENLRCTSEEMKKAINGHLSLTHSYFAPDNEMMQENMTVGEWRKKYKAEIERQIAQQMNKNTTLPVVDNELAESNYAGYAYDAVWTYAYALDKLMKQNESYLSSIHDENTTRKYVTLIQNTNFHGVSGHIQFSTGPSRFSNVNIMQWINDQMNIIGTYYPNRTNTHNEYSSGSLNVTLSLIKWLNHGGVKPWDGTPEEEVCVLKSFADALGSSCQTAIVVANVIGIGLLLLVVIIGFLIVKHKYDTKVKITQRYMKDLGIDLLSASTIGSLDKWEIARERVVINRKLGEGAFGFVYGGEAYFTDKGWVAVAVKTLKVGSSTEEKLDFLSEAEVMKRFEHKNIVQLLGVCTKNEPVYTIMEFMLYGDLKTFLLARRHLVNEKYPDDSDEISSRRLTTMALDVARALSYLAELKYVHRDVASRNCLVNVNKTVKLGDFGMTRPMCENDYYRFNRKGMLPVRWMSPESLVLGIFTPASDVWSYGVLLYEIITFGSFPFQGMSNNQVLEYVKQGNTLNIPQGIKPQLECLIKSCWNKEHKKRPPASEIVEFLANNPRLLAPCLDVPLSSVQMEDTEEINLTGDRNRRFSMGLRQRSLSHEIAEPLLPSPARFKQTRGSSLGEEPQDSLL